MDANARNIGAFPPAPAEMVGWPWDQEPDVCADRMPDGSPWPRISIITPSFNQGRFIEQTIRSILLQGYPNLEYIIIDGGSTDETCEVIRRYEPFVTAWVSEPDRGQSHAINKGLARCTGEIVNWINSDDLMCPGALRAVAEAWRRRPGTIVAGTVIDFHEDGREIVYPAHELTLRNFVHWRDACRNRMTWGQPATYLPLDAVNAAGGVREDLRFTMDHLLMIELLQRCEVQHIDRPFARFRIHQAAKTGSSGHARFRLERMNALRAMKELPVRVPAVEWREDYARTLVACAALEIQDGHPGRATARLLQAMWTSPRVTRQVWGELGLGSLASRKVAALFQRRGTAGGQPVGGSS